MQNGADGISVICRSEQKVVEHLQQCQHAGLPIEFTVHDTASSMHSFYELTYIMDTSKPFVVTTVDTIFKEEEFSAYLVAFQHFLKKGDGDGLMGVTDYIDDEKPLCSSRSYSRLHFRLWWNPRHGRLPLGQIHFARLPTHGCSRH